MFTASNSLATRHRVARLATLAALGIAGLSFSAAAQSPTALPVTPDAQTAQQTQPTLTAAPAPASAPAIDSAQPQGAPPQLTVRQAVTDAVRQQAADAPTADAPVENATSNAAPAPVLAPGKAAPHQPQRRVVTIIPAPSHRGYATHAHPHHFVHVPAHRFHNPHPWHRSHAAPSFHGHAHQQRHVVFVHPHSGHRVIQHGHHSHHRFQRH